MITAALFDAGSRILAALFALVPTTNLDTSGFAAAGATVGAAIFGFNDYFPISTFFQALGLVFAVWVVLGGWNAIVWVYHQFWGSS